MYPDKEKNLFLAVTVYWGFTWFILVLFISYWLVGWLGLWHIKLSRLFNAKSIFIQFFYKQFSLEWIKNLIVKTFLFQAIQLNQTVLIQTI